MGYELICNLWREEGALKLYKSWRSLCLRSDFWEFKNMFPRAPEGIHPLQCQKDYTYSFTTKDWDPDHTWGYPSLEMEAQPPRIYGIDPRPLQLSSQIGRERTAKPRSSQCTPSYLDRSTQVHSLHLSCSFLPHSTSLLDKDRNLCCSSDLVETGLGKSRDQVMWSGNVIRVTWPGHVIKLRDKVTWSGNVIRVSWSGSRDLH